MQEELRSKLSEAVQIVVPVADDSNEEPGSVVDVRPEDVWSSDKLILQWSSPTRAVEGTKVEC